MQELCYSMGSIHTLFFVGADFAGVSPALTRHATAAARVLCSVLRLWSQTAPVFKLGVAVVHTDIYGITHTYKWMKF